MKKFLIRLFSWVKSRATSLGANIPNIPIKTFLGLQDTPDSYTGQAAKVVKVKADESGLEFGVSSSPDLTPYAKLDSSNTPFTSTVNGGADSLNTQTRLLIRSGDGSSSPAYTGTGAAADDYGGTAADWQAGKFYTGLTVADTLGQVMVNILSWDWINRKVYDLFANLAINFGKRKLYRSANQDLMNQTTYEVLDWQARKFSEDWTHTQIATPANPSASTNKLYFKSDDKLYKLNSAGTETEVGGGGTQTGVMRFGFFNEDGSALTAGTTAYAYAPYSGTITGSWVLTETSKTPISCSAVLGVWRDTTGNYPPTSGDSITASAPPTLSTQTNASGSTGTWSLAVTAGDYFGVTLTSVSGAKLLELVLTYNKS